MLSFDVHNVNIVLNDYHCHNRCSVVENHMPKNEHIGFRTTPEVKKILLNLADQGYRTVSQQCEMIVIEWLKKNGHLKNPD